MDFYRLFRRMGSGTICRFSWISEDPQRSSELANVAARSRNRYLPNASQSRYRMRQVSLGPCASSHVGLLV
jgi:hypothetical protein